MQRILLGSTQSVSSYPRLAPDRIVTGVPSGVTALRVTPVARDTTYQPASVDPLTTSTDASISEGADSFTLNLTGDPVVIGRRYLIADAVTLRGETFISDGNDGAGRIYLAEPLRRDYSASANVNGLLCSIALSSSQTAQVGDGYVLFRATVGDQEYEWDEPFRVVRRITAVTLTTTSLMQLYPVARKLLSSTDTTGDEAIESVWRSVVVPLLSVKGVLDEDILTDDVIEPLHAAAVVLHLARQWPQAPSEFVQRLSDSYEQIKETTFARIDLAVRSQDEAVPDPLAPGAEPNRGAIRMTR